MSAKEDPDDDDEGLDWGTGWSRWAEYQALHGDEDPEIPQDWSDTKLVAWVNQTRRDYWRFQNGENTYLKQGGFAMLGKCGFDFGPNPNGGSDKEPKKKKPTPKKPSAKQAKKPAAKAKAAAAAASKEDSDDDDDEQEDEASSPPTRRSTRRRSTRRLSSVSASGQDSAVASSSAKRKRGDNDDDDTDTDNASEEEEDFKPAARTSRRTAKSNKSEPPSSSPPSSRYPRRTRTAPDPSPVSSSIVATSSTGKRKAAPAANTSSANKKVKTEHSTSSATKTHWKDYNTRQLVRVIPKEQEDEVRLQIQQDCAKLLESHEPMVADKAKGVDFQLAKSNVAWEERFLDFLVFRKMFGHGIVPKMFNDNEKLGRWTARNRRWRRCNDKRLTKSRLKRLNEAQFIWDAKKDPMFWTVQQQTTQAAAKWEARFHNLLTYKEEHGDCLVPKEYAPNMILSRWVADMRKQYKNKKAGNKFSTLDDEREERLNDVGFVWNTRTKAHMRQSIMKRFEDKWMECFNSLLEFKKTYGHTGVPRRWNDDPDLASWAMRQRALGRKKEAGEDSFLTDERYELLKSVDFIFNLDRRLYPMSGASANQAGTKDGDGDANDDDVEVKEEEEAAALAEDDEQAIAVAVEVPVDNIESQTPVAEVVRDLDNDDADMEGEGLTTPAAAAASMPKQTPSSASVERLAEKETIKETPSPPLSPLPDKKRRAKKSKSQAGEEKKSDNNVALDEESKTNDKKKAAGDKSTVEAEEGKKVDDTSKTAAEVVVKAAATVDTKDAEEDKSKIIASKKSTNKVKKAVPASVENSAVATESKSMNRKKDAKKAAVAGSKSAVDAKSPVKLEAVEKDNKASSAATSNKKKVGQKAKVKPDSDDLGTLEDPTAPDSVKEKKDEKDASRATGSDTSVPPAAKPADGDAMPDGDKKMAALGTGPEPPSSARRKKRQKANHAVDNAKVSVDSSTQAMSKAPASLTNLDSAAPSLDVKNSTPVKDEKDQVTDAAAANATDVNEGKTAKAASMGPEVAAHDKAASEGKKIKANNASTETAPSPMHDAAAAAALGLVELQAGPSEPTFVETCADEASSAGLQRLELPLDSPL